MTERDLLLRIARCALLRQPLENPGSTTPCSKIVSVQVDQAAGGGDDLYDEWQVPEPWTGHITTAPILFISSNPGISFTELYPIGRATDDELITFFSRRFDPDWPLTRQATQHYNVDGTYSESVAFWSHIKNRAQELLDDPVVAGVDYALTEVVHCKSSNEFGVSEACTTCADRYLSDILTLAGARLVIVMGEHARAEVTCHVQLELVDPAWPELYRENGNPEREFLFQPHPNSRGPYKVFDRALPPALLEYLRSRLRQGTTVEHTVRRSYALCGNPDSGVEPFLGNDVNPQVCVLGFNPGLNRDDPHRIPPPQTDAELAGCLRYFRSYLGRDTDFNRVWSRYCWLLSPGQESYGRTAEYFSARADEDLLLINLFQLQTKKAEELPAVLQRAQGQVALEILKLARPRVLVAQGAEAWEWIKAETEPLDRREHPPGGLTRYYEQTAEGKAGYRVALKRIPSVVFWLLPVFHLTGREHLREQRWTWFEKMVPRYRAELNQTWRSS